MSPRSMILLRQGLKVLLVLAVGWVSVATLGYGFALLGLEEWKRGGREPLGVASGRIRSLRRLENRVLEIRLENDPQAYFLPTEWIELPSRRPLRQMTATVEVGTSVSIRPNARRLVYELWVNPGTAFATRWVEVTRAQGGYDAFIDGQVWLGRFVLAAGFAIPALAAWLWFLARRRGQAIAARFAPILVSAAIEARSAIVRVLKRSRSD